MRVLVIENYLCPPCHGKSHSHCMCTLTQHPPHLKLLRPLPVMHLMHSHPTIPSMLPMSPHPQPWHSAPPNTPTSSSLPHGTRPGGVPAVGPTEIMPRLYLSDLADVENHSTLASLGITHVFSAMPGFIDLPSQILHHSGRRLPIHHKQIHIEDHPFAELAAHLPSSTAFIREALRDPEAKVLVHCVQGISRSASVICAFLMANFGWAPPKAVTFVKSKRWIAEPNFGFVAQLHEYEKTLQPHSTAAHAR